MRRGKGKRPQEKGGAYLTVYLALCLSVMTSLCLALVEGARKGAVRMETECVTDIAMNSILAEYHRELFRQYNIFAIDSSYGTGQPGKSNTEEHLRTYLTGNLSLNARKIGAAADLLYKDFLSIQPETVELTKVSILTDQKGAVFRRAAVEAIKDDVGLAALEELQQWLKVVEDNNLTGRNVAKEKAETDDKLMDYDGKEVAVEVEEDEDTETPETEESTQTKPEEREEDAESEKTGGTEGAEAEEGAESDLPEIKETTETEKKTKTKWETVDIDNPTDTLEKNRKKGILSLVIENPEALSANSVPKEQLIYERMKQGNINQGNISLEKQSEVEKVTEFLLFQQYLFKYMGHYQKTAEEDALQYQIEYLLVGKGSDIDNLKGVADRLCALREAANATYLFSDQLKRKEAELMAAALSAVLLIPELQGLFTVSILLGWAYAESLYDVKQLLAGGRVPLMKNSSTWHYSLESAMLGEVKDKVTAGTGLSYEDYLRIFVGLSNKNTITGRAMDMVEADIRKTPGNKEFRLDGCYVKVESHITFKSKYGYGCEITRTKKY